MRHQKRVPPEGNEERLKSSCGPASSGPFASSDLTPAAVMIFFSWRKKWSGAGDHFVRLVIVDHCMYSMEALRNTALRSIAWMLRGCLLWAAQTLSLPPFTAVIERKRVSCTRSSSSSSSSSRLKISDTSRTGRSKYAVVVVLVLVAVVVIVV